jgi:hypothetical protein
VQFCTALSLILEMEAGGKLSWLLVLCDDLLRDGIVRQRDSTAEKTRVKS